MTTVKEIHDDFYGAEERLFVEAVILTQNPQFDKLKYASRFEKIGFTSAKAVKEAKELEEKQNVASEMIANIEYFRVHYPNNKFITEPEVKKLCEKYGLLMGNSSTYIGDIPEKNLIEIEKFKLREEDFAIDFFRYTLGVDPFNISGDHLGFIRFWREAELNPPTHKVEKEKPAFKICAPKEDFETWGFEVKDGFNLVWDPVVLQPVKGGFLIVTAWGNEASDEIIVNQNNN